MTCSPSALASAITPARAVERIFEAIAAGNATAAGKTMKQHLDEVLSAFIKGSPLK
jgi:DNA-binding GntR family transcriptional regulator